MATTKPTKSQAHLMNLARAVLVGGPQTLQPVASLVVPAPQTFAEVFRATRACLTALVELAEGQGDFHHRLRVRVCCALHEELKELLEAWGALERAAAETKEVA